MITPGLVVRVVLSVGLLATAVWLTSDRLDWRHLAALNAPTIIACVLLSALLLWVLAWRWRLVVAELSDDTGKVPAIGTFIRQTWLCLAVNQVLPSVVGGDAVRASMLAGSGLPLARAAGSVFVDRVYGLVGLALLTLASVFLLGSEMVLTVLAISAAILAGAALLAFAGRRLFAEKLRGIVLPARPSARRMAVLVLAAIAGHVINIGIFLIVAYGLGVALPILPAVAVMGAVFLLGMLPVSVAGWGLRELALVQAFGQMGFEADKVILASIAYGLVVFLTQASGFLLLARRSRS